MIDPERLTKEQIQKWLDDYHGGDRIWLAEQLGISLGGLAHCFSKQGFSAKGKAGVARLMELDEARRSGSAEPIAEQLEMTQGEWERFEEAREYMGNPARPIFIRQCIVHHVAKVLDDKAWDKVGKSASAAFYDDGAEKDRAAEETPDTLGGPGEG